MNLVSMYNPMPKYKDLKVGDTVKLHSCSLPDSIYQIAKATSQCKSYRNGGCCAFTGSPDIPCKTGGIHLAIQVGHGELLGYVSICHHKISNLNNMVYVK